MEPNDIPKAAIASPCHKIHTKKNLVKGAELYRARQRWRRAANLETARAYDRERYAIRTGSKEYPAPFLDSAKVIKIGG
jgi:hypothetical protein